MATAKRKPSKRRTGPKVDPYQVVTDAIVTALEAGVVPWHRPWRTGAAGNLPMSLSTRRAYRGSNVFVLGMTALAKGYSSRWWGTYKQIAALGGQVRGGEKGTQVVKVLVFDAPEDKDDPDGKRRKIHTLKLFTVFNVDQVDGLQDPTPLVLDDHARVSG